ncbi:NTP transferase domain-containing protein [Sporosarcina sp. FSL W8-0480]|uniref:phosphocholine cytidylyltransferase family protein n=1 Tax=Sporosarcina sp. FSL W8-0480 TaxID=2954701 RepID=UPI0030DCF5F2
MKALILNSGMGKRMGDLTKAQPKCMTEIGQDETILSRQLKLLQKSGITNIVITTGPFDKVLVDYCHSLSLSLDLIFINNPIYDQTNYIYSIYLAKDYLEDDILLMHGDLVFDKSILDDVLNETKSCMTVSTTLPLPKKDFKAVINNNKIEKVGIEFFENTVTAQPLYKLYKNDWEKWLDRIVSYCEHGQVTCYAENALNEVSDKCSIFPLDFTNKLCAEIDTKEDLLVIKERLNTKS